MGDNGSVHQEDPQHTWVRFSPAFLALCLTPPPPPPDLDPDEMDAAEAARKAEIQTRNKRREGLMRKKGNWADHGDLERVVTPPEPLLISRCVCVTVGRESGPL